MTLAQASLRVLCYTGCAVLSHLICRGLGLMADLAVFMLLAIIVHLLWNSPADKWRFACYLLCVLGIGCAGISLVHSAEIVKEEVRK